METVCRLSLDKTDLIFYKEHMVTLGNAMHRVLTKLLLSECFPSVACHKRKQRGFNFSHIFTILRRKYLVNKLNISKTKYLFLNI